MKHYIRILSIFTLIITLIACQQINSPTTVNLTDIKGVRVPVTGETPVSEITETAQYAGIVTWSPSVSTFAATAVYTATITLTAKSGYTLTGLNTDYFNVAVATSVSNTESSGIISAEFSSTASSPPTYAIGDTGPSGVGLVFIITDGGLHGYEVAPEDQSTGAFWSNIDLFYVNGGTPLPTVIGTGFSNTEAIINQSGHTASAAQLCRAYRSEKEGNWFLPSKDELNLIWVTLVRGTDGYNNGVGGFSDSRPYWSSSEDDHSSTWFQRFDYGTHNICGKDAFHLSVRAVRVF